MRGLRLPSCLGLLLFAGLLCAARPAGAQGRSGGETEEERLFQEAERLFDAGRYADAAPLYDRALQLNQTRPATFVKRATLYFRDRRYDKAIELLTRAQRLAPDDLNLKTVLGLCLYQSGDKDRGLRYLSDVAARQPEAYEAQLQIGQHYAQIDPGRAIPALELYLRYRPEDRRSLDATTQVLLGTAYFLKGRLPEAQKVLEAAAAARPKDARTRLLLGAVVLARGDFEKALALHQPFVAEIPRRPAIAYNLALAYLKLGRRDEAGRLAGQYAALHPEDPRGRILLGDIALAGGKEADGKTALRFYEEADRLWRRLRAGDGGPAVSLDARLARAYLLARDPARAIAVAQARLAVIGERRQGEAEGEPAPALSAPGSPGKRSRGRKVAASRDQGAVAPPESRGGARAGEEAELLAVLLEADLALGQTGQTGMAGRPDPLSLSSRLAQLASGDAAALALAGSGALLGANLDRARRLYTDALAQDRNLRRARVGLARTLVRLAVQGITQAAGQTPGQINDERGLAVQAAIPLLEQALQLDDSPYAVRNLALAYLTQNRYDAAERVLSAALGMPGAGGPRVSQPGEVRVWRNDPLLLRLYGRALTGLSRPEQALQAYEHATAEVNQLLQAASAQDRPQRQALSEQLAELHIELGGRYLSAGRLDETVDLLERAGRELGQVSPRLSDEHRTELSRVAGRNLALAYLSRGRTRLAQYEGELTQGPPPPTAARLAEGALEDLQRAVDSGGLLSGRHETGTALCAAALAATGAARYSLGRELCMKAQAEGGCDLAPPFERMGVDLLLAYVSYRDTGSPAQREQALRSLIKLQGRVGSGTAAAPQLTDLLTTLLRSTRQMLAYDLYVLGKLPQAAQLLRAAQKLSAGPHEGSGARAESDAVLQHNLAVIDLQEGRPAGERTLERLGGRPPDALVNLGILYDRRGESRKALELYRRAWERGARTPKLREWIDVKDRLLGEAAP